MDHRGKISIAIFLALYLITGFSVQVVQQNDLSALKANKTEEIRQLNDKHLTSVSNRLDLADKMGFGLKSNCRETFIVAMNVTVHPRHDQLRACYNENTKDLRYTVVESCYTKNIEALTFEETVLHKAVNGCIMLNCGKMFKVTECNVWFPEEKL